MVNLNYCKLKNTHPDHVLQSMVHLKNLKEAHFRGLNLVETNKVIGRAFVDCKKLVYLDISNNNIGLINQRCHDAIQDLIANTQFLKVLIMEDVAINDEEGDNYLDSLHMNSTLTSFKFERHPNLSRDTLSRIEAELNTNTLINALILPNYNFEYPSKLDLSSKSMKKIDFVIKFLKCNPKIYEVDFSHNHLGDKEIEELTDYIIKKGSKLHVLNLCHNKFSIAGCKHLTKLFYQDSEVLTLDLSKNNIGTSSFKDLLYALRRNLRTRKLYVKDCNIGKRLMSNPYSD